MTATSTYLVLCTVYIMPTNKMLAATAYWCRCSRIAKTGGGRLLVTWKEGDNQAWREEVQCRYGYPIPIPDTESIPKMITHDTDTDPIPMPIFSTSVSSIKVNIKRLPSSCSSPSPSVSSPPSPSFSIKPSRRSRQIVVTLLVQYAMAIETALGAFFSPDYRQVYHC